LRPGVAVKESFCCRICILYTLLFGCSQFAAQTEVALATSEESPDLLHRAEDGDHKVPTEVGLLTHFGVSWFLYVTISGYSWLNLPMDI
jgi:hypothetical protein